jgi:hypothetical protein
VNEAGAQVYTEPREVACPGCGQVVGYEVVYGVLYLRIGPVLLTHAQLTCACCRRRWYWSNDEWRMRRLMRKPT